MKSVIKQIARAVIFHPDGKLLLIERRKDTQHYFVLPGGHLEDLESPEWAVVREVKEETSLDVTVITLLYTHHDAFGQKHFIYLCNYHGGELQLAPDSVEAQVARQSGQVWRPDWFTPEQLEGQTIYPEGLLEQLELDEANDFADTPREIPHPKSATA